MRSLEAERGAMSAILDEVVTPRLPDRGRSTAKRERRERRDAFLTRASELLDTYPQAAESSDERITRPIEITVHDQTVHVQIIEITHGDPDRHWERWTGIQVTQPETGSAHLLFGIEQISSRLYVPEGADPNTKTTIRNHRRGAPAKNDEVSRGLQAIQFIADQLANQPQQQ